MVKENVIVGLDNGLPRNLSIGIGNNELKYTLSAGIDIEILLIIIINYYWNRLKLFDLITFILILRILNCSLVLLNIVNKLCHIYSMYCITYAENSFT